MKDELVTEEEFFAKTVREELPDMLVLSVRLREGDMTLGEMLWWSKRIEAIAWCFDRVLTPANPYYA
jgi:hypothetical protein